MRTTRAPADAIDRFTLPERAAAPDGERRLAPRQTYALILKLEKDMRAAGSVAELQFIALNQMGLVARFQTAAMLQVAGRSLTTLALSNLPDVDRNVPFVRWLEQLGEYVMQQGAGRTALSEGDLAGPLADEWGRHAPAQAIFLPLCGRVGPEPFAYLGFLRSEPWSEGEQVILDHLKGCLEHAWRALDPHVARKAHTSSRRLILRRALAGAAVAAFLAGLAAPVRQSVLAPAEITALDPEVVSTPNAGVIKTFHVRPNDPVSAGDLLFSFDDVSLRAKRDVAQHAVALAQAESLVAQQGAFQARAKRGENEILAAKADLRREELRYATALLDQADVRARSDGVAVFSSVEQWIGQPVQVGEWVMKIARPEQVEFTAQIPVKDAIALQPGDAVTLFLDADPLNSLSATLASVSYEAAITPSGVLAYAAHGRMDAGQAPPRIGLQGTAKIYGERAPLAFYLFRRPLSAVRQILGF